MNAENAHCNYLIRNVFNNTLLVLILFFLFNTANAQKRETKAEKQKNECFAKVGNIESRAVQKKMFNVQEGIIAYTKVSPSHWEPIEVNSFSVLILRDSSVVFQHRNTGNKFESSVSAAFQNLQSNDSVLFFSIDTRLADGKSLFVQPLEFKIE